MTDKKYPPRFWLGHGYADEFGKYDWEFSEKETPSHNEEYCSMVEHAAIVAELERKLGVAVECLNKYESACFEVNGEILSVGSKAKQALAEIGGGA